MLTPVFEGLRGQQASTPKNQAKRAEPYADKNEASLDYVDLNQSQLRNDMVLNQENRRRRPRLQVTTEEEQKSKAREKSEAHASDRNSSENRRSSSDYNDTG